MSDQLSADACTRLAQYNDALRQFLSLSDTSSSKSNPSRAAKARGKLLKLSPSQFFELSTDVFDELQRRIDEAQAEPEFLLPKDNFHRKRNEAREKLGSLQPRRFRDLVSDIHYEIERRGLDKPIDENKRISAITVESTTSNETNGHQNYHHQQQQQQLQQQQVSKPQGAVKTLQQSSVIPTKADLAWSSDEEDGDTDAEDSLKILNNSHTKTRSLEISKGDLPSIISTHDKKTFSPSHQPSRSFNNANSNVNGHNSILSGASLSNMTSPRSNNMTNGIVSPKRSSVEPENDVLGNMNEFANEQRVQRGLSTSKNRNKDREIQLLLAEGTKMDEKITDLEQRNAFLQSKADKFESENQDLQLIKETLSSKVQELEDQVSQKDELIKTLDTQSKNIITPISSDNDQSWKPKYNQLKNQKLEEFLALDIVSPNVMQKFVAEDGLIPYNLMTEFFDSVNSFMIKLNDQVTSKDVGSLFSQLSRISDVASKISSYAPHSERSELVRATVSHAITSTRYFAIYSEMLPKLIIQSAVSEVAFSVCDLISEVRLLKNNTSTEERIESNTNAPKTFADDTNDGNDVSPVRPLRMAKKVTDGTSRSVSSSTPKSLNLTINTSASNNTTPVPVETKPFHLTKDSPLSSKVSGRVSNFDRGIGNVSATSINIDVKTPSKLSPVVTRYSPESIKTPTESKITPGLGLRKSSSSNILSKVRQFEQADETRKSSPQKSVISPLSDNVVGLFGKRKSSESVPFNNNGADMKAASQREPELLITEEDLKPKSNTDDSAIPPVNISDDFNPACSNIDTVAGVSSSAEHISPEASTKFNQSHPGVIQADVTNEEVNFDDFKSSLLANNKIRQQLTENQASSEIIHGVPSNNLTKDSLEDDLNYSPLDHNTKLEKKTSYVVPEVRDAKPLDNTTGKGDLKKKSENDVQPWRLDSLVRDVEGASRSTTKNVSIPLETSNDSHESVEKKPSPLQTPVNDFEDETTEVVVKPIKLTKKEITEPASKSRVVETVNELTATGRESGSLTAPISVPDEDNYRVESQGSPRSFDENEFDVDEFDIGDPDNTLSELLLYLEHQTVKVISTIQALLSSIKMNDSTKGDLRTGSKAINNVVSQMVEATSTAMNQSRNAQLKEHGRWVVDSLSDCGRRMDVLCKPTSDDDLDNDYADKNFKQRLAGVAFDVAKCTKELVKSVEEANLKAEIAHLNARLG